ncbi:hypothetical protein PG993_003366 [Apiospora rasikravindrae]|uniref:Ubiquitin-like protease family profile domain-containing protein n=1 Tax=Apiospora rasikravindrae TaxID=990691 RepID=A0ABR1U1H9_9PEZI
MSQPAKKKKGVKRKYEAGLPEDGKHSAWSTKEDYGKYATGEDVPLDELVPRLKIARIAIDHSQSQGNDHHPRLANAGCPRLSNFAVPLNAMNRLQEASNDQITTRSMVSALLGEQACLDEPDIATVINFDGWDLFQCDGKEFEIDRKKWEPSIEVDGDVAQFDYFDIMMQMRQAEYVFWPYQFRYGQGKQAKGHWVLIVMRVEAIELSRSQYDRYASDIAVIDPVGENKSERYSVIYDRVQKLLWHAHILVDTSSWMDNAFVVKELKGDWNWASGHACYLHAHEFFRRLRCIIEQGERGRYVASFWKPFEDTYSPGFARKLMLSACAHRVIEKSEHYGRLAIEFPGFAKSQDAYNYWPRSVDFRDEEEMEFDSKAAVTPSDIIKSDADKIGTWSIYLDADQRWEGKWRYVRAPGAGPTDNLTRDEARYDALTTDP